MSYFSKEELNKLGFKSLGQNVRISTRASIYNHGEIEIGDNSRVDDFSLLSGKIKIGSFVHITPMCLLAGGELGIDIGDFCTFAYGVKIFTQSDDYSGETLTNSNVPKKFKNEYISRVTIEKHSIVGAGAMIMPGANLAEGTSIGAMSLLLSNTENWSIYVGIPAKKIKNRSKKLLKLEQSFWNEKND